MSKKWFKRIGITLLIGIGLFCLYIFFWPAYDPRHGRELQKLLAIGGGSRPLRDALERYKDTTGCYPATITNLFLSYLQPSNSPDGANTKDWAGWEYEGATNNYEIFYQLDWDGGLYFQHSASGTNDWFWYEGVGTVDLTREFQGQ